MKPFRFLSALLLTVSVTLAAAADDGYKLIAHSSSVPVASISAKEVAPLFLKKTTTYAKWGSQQKVVPIDLAADSGTREAFSKSVHGKAVMAVKSFWQQQIFSGRGNPPAELASDAEVIAFVAKTPGAIGYVSAGASLPDGVKQVKVTR